MMDAHLFPPVPAPIPSGPTAAEIVEALRRKRMRVHPERALCDDIESVLTAAGFAFRREHRFNAADRIDFLVGRVGIEVKIRGGTARRDIYRQCLRYCAHDAVSELILATTLPMGLPAMPKPTLILNLSSAWL